MEDPSRAVPRITQCLRTLNQYHSQWHQHFPQPPHTLLQRPKLKISEVSKQNSILSQLQFNRTRKTVDHGCYCIRIWNKLGRSWTRSDKILKFIRTHLETRSHTIHVIAPLRNLGLVVDRPPGVGHVYIRSLHPLSPLRDQVQLKDKIIAIDGEDVQQLGPVDVGKILCTDTTKAKRNISIVRGNDVLVG